MASSKNQARKLEERRARRYLYAEKDKAYAEQVKKLTDRDAGRRAQWESERPYDTDHAEEARAEQAKITDVISQGRKQPMTWDEINSAGSGGSKYV